jgi:hypothetical protein
MLMQALEASAVDPFDRTIDLNIELGQLGNYAGVSKAFEECLVVRGWEEVVIDQPKFEFQADKGTSVRALSGVEHAAQRIRLL